MKESANSDRPGVSWRTFINTVLAPAWLLAPLGISSSHPMGFPVPLYRKKKALTTTTTTTTTTSTITTTTTSTSTPCPVPNITGFTSGVVAGTNFLSPQGSGYMREYIDPPGMWQTWSSGYIDWTDTTVILAAGLNPDTTKIKIINDCGETSNEFVVS